MNGARWGERLKTLLAASKRGDGDAKAHLNSAADTANSTTYTYDDLGRQISVTDALGNKTTVVYDASDRVIKQTNALGEETLYTYNGADLIEVEVGKTALARGRILRYEYDSKARKIKEKRFNPADGSEQVTNTIDYDADDHVVSETDALGQKVT